MGEKIAERIIAPIIIIFSGALLFGVIDGVVYLLRNVFYGVIMIVLMIAQLFWWIIKNLILDLICGYEFRDIGKSWYEYFTADDVWWCVTIILAIIYAYLLIGSLILMIFGLPKEQSQEEQEGKKVPPKVLKMLKGLVSCGAILIIACWIATAVFIYNMVGGCD